MKMKNPGDSPASQKRKKAGQLRPSPTVSSHKNQAFSAYFPEGLCLGLLKMKSKIQRKM
jgi:hypothetical protein